MKKIAFIIVRYGENINGGAEVHCQMLAERLLPYYEVEVLTTTIRAFNHPDQDYTEGVSSWNGVTIRRFKPQPIDQEQFRPFRKKYKTARRIRQYLKKLNLLRAASFLHPEWKSGIENERPFYESTATHAPGLLRYIESHKAEYAAFIFANFYTPQAVLGSVVAPEKSLLIPMAHPDKPLYYCINAPMFTRVRHIAFNTEAERQLCRSVFGQFLAPNSIVGCGIEMAPEAEWSGVKAKYELPDEYVLYLGRVSKAKVDKLLPYFLRCKAKYGGDAKLIHLPEIGIKGNTHALFSDLNNKEILKITEEWLAEKGLDKNDDPHLAPKRPVSPVTIPLEK